MPPLCYVPTGIEPRTVQCISETQSYFSRQETRLIHLCYFYVLYCRSTVETHSQSLKCSRPCCYVYQKIVKAYYNKIVRLYTIMVLATNSLTNTHFGMKTKKIYMYGRRNRFVSKIGNKKNTYCGKVISSQKFVRNFLIFCTNGRRICMDLRIFESFL